jgi:hypothetical protein
MSKYRYVITGGDNGYCAKCGGLCDRSLLRIDDKNKTYKQYYFFEGCLGKYCWRQQELYGGAMLVRGMLIDGHKISWNMSNNSKNKVWLVQTNGTELEYIPVVVKGNKYGKDGEFGDKLDTYKYEGFVEPEERIKEAQERARQAMKDMYKRIGERSMA